jgi:hypothetical protein
MKASQPPSKLAVGPREAAELLSVSRASFDRHIGPSLRWVRRGRLKLVAIAELERFLREEAALTLRDEL